MTSSWKEDLILFFFNCLLDFYLFFNLFMPRVNLCMYFPPLTGPHAGELHIHVTAGDHVRTAGFAGPTSRYMHSQMFQRLLSRHNTLPFLSHDWKRCNTSTVLLAQPTTCGRLISGVVQLLHSWRAVCLWFICLVYTLLHVFIWLGDVRTLRRSFSTILSCLWP